MDVIDLKFQGHPRVIATAVISGPDGVVLVDPGPSSCLATLDFGLAERGLSVRDVRAVLLTHIHLDHAGACGTLVERVPDLRVYVHERGAPHLVNPAKLLASATRLYGDRMDTLWGPFVAVPADNVVVLAGGEQVTAAGHVWRVAYTPGHAVHHVSYLDEETGTAFVGDTAGIRVGRNCCLAPTPPPDIDIDRWQESLDLIEAWQPVTLFLTHFGAVTPARAHLAVFRLTLAAAATAVHQSLLQPGTDEARIERFVEQLRREVRLTSSEADAAATELAAPFDQLWAGLARYWRKRDPGLQASS